jgi:hypothetical protein
VDGRSCPCASRILGEKEAVLAAHREAFFTIPYFDGHPAIPIRLGLVSEKPLPKLAPQDPNRQALRQSYWPKCQGSVVSDAERAFAVTGLHRSLLPRSLCDHDVGLGRYFLSDREMRQAELASAGCTSILWPRG